MGTPDRKITELVDRVRSWIPRRSEPANVSRDFWMPDQSCRVCYECDSQFTVFNRKHHCRLCGRVFCAKCTANSVPAPSVEKRTSREDWDRIRVCNYCFKQWKEGLAGVDNGTTCVLSPDLSRSPSAASLASSKSSGTCNSSNSTVGATPYSTGQYHCVPYGSVVSPRQPAQMDPGMVEQENMTSGRSSNPSAAALSSSPNQFGYCMNRSDDDDDDYGVYHFDSEVRQFSQADDYYGAVNMDEIDHVYEPERLHLNGASIDSKSFSASPLPDNFDIQGVDIINKPVEEVDENGNGDEREAPSYNLEEADREPVDFENNGLLWLPPEPEDEEDDREAVLIEEEDDDDEGATGEWGYLRSSNSFGGGEFRSREKPGEEHRKAMKNVVEEHFRSLVSQLLHVENLSVGEDDKDSWLNIVTSLSWEAATLLKPDTSRGGGMDPGGYVKVKCIASGRRSESTAVKGVVCKKNVAHRRMNSKIDKSRFLILGGALEYQRVSTHFSSFDTLLQQEMDHLKMAVAKIDAHHPNVLLVEKSVSRYAQEYLLAKDISLVLNIKRPLLERIARCTGGQIVPSIDHLTSPKLGYCDMFHVEKFFEEHGSAGQGGKKLTKTLMFFEGCPKPLGCTILLKGDNGDELKKVKHVVQYGVFAAYHLALETSFLADEGASLPELPLKSPITVALPDKPSSIDKSISTIPGFIVPASGKSSISQPITEFTKSKKVLISDTASFPYTDSVCELEAALSACLSKGQDISGSHRNELSSDHVSGVDTELIPKESFQSKTANFVKNVADDHLVSSYFGTPDTFGEGIASGYADGNVFAANHHFTPELSSLKQDSNCNNEEMGSSKEEFPPSPSDHQSILVSLSTRCVWKGTVCERAHRFRIKYYGSFDKPLGRFLRDDLFEQSYRCRSCDMPSEAHVHCYTHRQGSLTISVKKLPELPLPGERDGKVWMWHRCLRCPHINGIPPATRRIVMSDAAWGLSFGKFLELSFSNHAAASRVASCGHSLHRDCLRFYGFGKMVACFRYASIDVHSVYLPPSKVEFHSDNQEWIQKEANEVRHMAELLFTEVYNALNQILEKRSSAGSEDSDLRSPESSQRITELEEMLQKEKQEFEESLRKVLFGEVKTGQPAIDILEINKLRRWILFHSYVWDQRLIHSTSSKSNVQERQRSCISKLEEKPINTVDKLSKSNVQERQRSCISKLEEKPINTVDKLAEMSATTKPGKGFSSCDSFLSDTKSDLNSNQGRNAGHISQSAGDSVQRNDTEECLSSLDFIRYKPDALESGEIIRRALSEVEFPIKTSLSDTLDAAWTGESQTTSITAKENGPSVPNSTSIDSSTMSNLVTANLDLETSNLGKGRIEVTHSLGSTLPTKGTDSLENSASRVGTSFLNFPSSFGKNYSLNAQKLGIGDHNPLYVSLFKELERQSGARLLLPVGVNDTVVPVYDDEPTSIIAYALVSSEYNLQMSELERPKGGGDSTASLPPFDTVSLLSLNSSDETASDTYRSFGSNEESILSMSGTWSSFVLDPLLYTKDLHVRVSFTDDGPLGKVKYSVTCYYAKRFDALRRTSCSSERDFIRSLSRCKKWGAQGGKSNVFFAKTLDDRFIVKQVTKTELESFIKFAPAYFKYLSESISTRSPTCLAKILGIYQVSLKHLKGGKESKMDVLVMENLLCSRNVTRLYDLKGSSRSRYNPDTSGSNKVLLDQNLIEAMPTSPIFVGNKAKRLLERAVWNDTSFLASIDVMDYSLLVGVDEEKHELVLGIIDFMRQYTWDKHLETWVKTSGILGGPKNTTPTVISPQQYKKRFRKAMSTYFIMMPDQWSSPTILPSGSQSDLCEEN